jgi:HK97 gp10 family phage protein
MASLSFEVSGRDTLQAKLSGFGMTGKQVVADQLNIGAKLIETRAKQNAAFITGNLRRTIHVLQDATPDNLEVIIEASASYAAAVEKGTRPHLIEPVNAKVLAFKMQGVPETVFATHVHHPGTQAQPFMAPAVEDLRDEILSNIERALREELSA